MGKGKAEVIQTGLLDMQVCVPDKWTDEQVKDFADFNNPCGTSGGWFIRKEGSELLEGAPERQPCKNRKGFVHIMLEA